MTQTCLRCWTRYENTDATDLSCPVCAKRGEEPIWRRVIVSDSVVNGKPQGRVHIIHLDDSEPHPESPDDMRTLLFTHSEEKPALADLALVGVATEESEDKTQAILAALDAIKGSQEADALAWSRERMEAIK